MNLSVTPAIMRCTGTGSFSSIAPPLLVRELL